MENIQPSQTKPSQTKAEEKEQNEKMVIIAAGQKQNKYAQERNVKKPREKNGL